MMNKTEEAINHLALNIADKARKLLNNPLSRTEESVLLGSILSNAGDILEHLKNTK
jgi:hypothetical protein